MSRQSLVEALPVLAEVAGKATDAGETGEMKKLAEQILNAAIIAALPVLPTLLLDDLDWRVPCITFGVVFLSKLALARGLKQ